MILCAFLMVLSSGKGVGLSRDLFEPINRHVITCISDTIDINEN